MSAHQDGGGRSESLSIEETNKLRAKLGLAPLDTNETGDASAKKEKQDVHVPAENLGDRRREKKMREKLDRTKSMRKMHQKLSSVKTLGEASGSDDDTTSWLRKSRKVEDERRKAEKRQRELDAMDEEFGVSAILDEELSRKNTKSRREKGYSSADLSGLTVEHDEDAFMDGTATILTLKDQDVLEDADDVLVNVNIIDLERAKKNRENKKRKPDYRPWEEEELDEDGMPHEKSVLSKYDEEIEKQEKKSFRLDASGAADLSDKMVMEEIRRDMKARAQTLDYSKGELAREYYTSGEMTSFKKPKKKRKVKKRMLKADDLLKMDAAEEEEEPTADRKSSSRDHPHESSRKPAPPVSIKQEPRDNASDKLSDEEDDDSELRIALARTRRLRQMERRRSPSPVQQDDTRVKMEVESDDEDEENRGILFGGSVSISTTSEFCRTVGTEDSPTHQQPPPPPPMSNESDDDDDMDIEEEEGEVTEAAAGWSQIDPKQKKKEKSDVKTEPEEGYFLDSEPIVSNSMAACLQMADQKGFLEQSKIKKEKGVSLQLVGSAADMDAKARDKAGERRERERRDRDRERDRDHDRYDRDRNPLDKPGYHPNVNIQYVDDTGKLLDQKRAFQHLSHKFHGKTSGKAKTEKRKKKEDEHTKMLKMSSTDTPLATRALLESKLKETKSAHLVLSGSAHRSLSANTITKNQ